MTTVENGKLSDLNVVLFFVVNVSLFYYVKFLLRKTYFGKFFHANEERGRKIHKIT